MRRGVLLAALALVTLVGAVVAPGASAYIYWANYNDGTIGRANQDGSGVSQSFISGAGVETGLAVDGAHIYWTWTDCGNTYGVLAAQAACKGWIGRANLNGSNFTPHFIVTEFPIAPYGLAVAGAHIYWLNGHQSLNSYSIGRAKTNGTGIKQNFITVRGRFIQTFGLAADSTHIYWTNYLESPTTAPSRGAIGRANLDASHVNQHFITGLTISHVNGLRVANSFPAGLAVDRAHIYWTNADRAAGAGGGTIGRATIDGTGVNEHFITGTGLTNGGIAVDATHIYWPNRGSNFGGGSIGRANLNGTGVDQSFITTVTDPAGVAVDRLGPGGSPPPPPPPRPPRPRPPSSPIGLLPLYVGATLGNSERHTVALMTYPKVGGKALPGSDFHVELRWGDGSPSTGEVSRVSLGFLDFLFPKTALYFVRGSHRYLSLKPSRIELTVTKQGVHSATARAHLLVDRADPAAYFFSTPDTPHQAETAFHGLDTNSIADVVPATPGPFERPVKEYRWEFGDGNPVIDSAATRPKYTSLLAQLANDPSNNDLKQKGIDMGILPGNAKSGPLGIGGLSADEVRQLVKDWQVEFPAHVVPHVYPFSGTIGVRLTVTDTAGHTSQYVRNLTVSQECLQWGGNGLFGWNPFRGYTTCDTRAGFESEIGPHRAPDYAVISLSKGFDLPPVARGLSALGAAQIYITRGVLHGAPNSVLLGAQLSVGLGISSKTETSVGFGWVGPPDPDHQPTDAAISGFINGFDIPAGLSAGIHAGPVSLGLGLNFIYSPSENQGGVEAYGGNTGISANVGGSCAAPLEVVGSGAASFLKRLYGTWNTAPPKHSPTIVAADLEYLGKLLVGHVSNIGQTVGQALAYCAP